MKIKFTDEHLAELPDVLSQSKCYWCGKITPYYTCSTACLRKHNDLMAIGRINGVQTYASVDEAYEANGRKIYGGF